MDPNRANIIITGSSGMIGSPLCAMLGAAYNVVGSDRAGSPYPPIEVVAVGRHAARRPITEGLKRSARGEEHEV